MDGTPLTDRSVAAVPSGLQAEPAGQQADPMIGRVLDDRYRIEARVGAGGMGVVYRAAHTIIDKQVAIKVLRARYASDEDIVKRFLLEAQLASKIHHPNVVEISDFGQLPEGTGYFVMELLQGHSLADEIDGSGRLEPRRAIGIAVQVARGLAAAHDLDIVHRDLKPDNVFLCDTEDGAPLVKIFDFGVARVIGRKTRITKMGAVIGTPEYMSPEQSKGGELDGRSDLYALGVITFEMLTGKVPFRGATAMDTLTKQMMEPPPKLQEVNPTVLALPQIERTLNRLLAKPVDERPQTGEDSIELLARALQDDLGDPHDRADRNKATVALGSGRLDAGGRGDSGTGIVARGSAPDWDFAAVSLASARAAAAMASAPTGQHSGDFALLARRRRWSLVAGAAAIVLASAAGTVGIARWMNAPADSASNGDPDGARAPGIPASGAASSSRSLVESAAAAGEDAVEAPALPSEEGTRPAEGDTASGPVEPRQPAAGGQPGADSPSAADDGPAARGHPVAGDSARTNPTSARNEPHKRRRQSSRRRSYKSKKRRSRKAQPPVRDEAPAEPPTDPPAEPPADPPADPSVPKGDLKDPFGPN